MPRKGEKVSWKFQGNENSGRQTKKEEIAAVINGGLANKIANKRLVKLDGQENVPIDEMKVVVMPVVLKGMTDKTDITSLGEKIIPIYGGQSTNGVQVHGHECTPQDIPTQE